MIDGSPASNPAASGAAPILPPELTGAFVPSVRFVTVESRDRPHDGTTVWVATPALDGSLPVSARNVPLLALAAVAQAPVAPPRLAVVAVEGRDRRMADQIAGLLNPATTRLALVHVTWVPGLAPSPLDPTGIDNPAPTDLLAYEGASDALIDTAQALRDAGFVVSTHLRQDKHPGVALRAFVSEAAPALIVVGLHRHGEGIGTLLLRDTARPVLFVDARSEAA
jgi:hypothetical protein